ncbi:hypothetical protein [Gilliamella sp. App4-10]|uniref:hypothetical protein n=1 Tax=Gilliamella sp. App4-10 TaxID=3120231 RepID=UPI001147A394|nr:hypothetical protein [Gilliamella apicola]
MYKDLPCISDIVIEHNAFIRKIIFSKLEDYPDKASLTNKLMVILEGMLNISVVYKTDQRLHKQTQQDTLSLVPDLLNNESVIKTD